MRATRPRESDFLRGHYGAGIRCISRGADQILPCEGLGQQCQLVTMSGIKIAVASTQELQIYLPTVP